MLRLRRTQLTPTQSESISGNLPNHIAFVMDGNRRYARARGIPLEEAYRLGKEKTRVVMRWCRDYGVEYATFHALSTDNLAHRPAAELEMLFDIYEQGFLELAEDREIHDNNVRCIVLGDRALLPLKVIRAIEAAEGATKVHTGQKVIVMLAYGGRYEILSAVRSILDAPKTHNGESSPVQENSFSAWLYTAGIPDPDLVLRTSGEIRLSNFMLWQTAYSELYFLKANWPELNRRHFRQALRSYQARRRRYGA